MLDSGDVDADLLVTAQTPHQIDVVGPPFGSYSRPWREGQGDDLQAFVIDWEAQQARGPQGHSSVHWRPGHNVSGDPVIRIRFDGATCRACPTRRECTSAQAAPRQLTVSPQVHHEALQAARQWQETPEFKAQDALRAGVESSLSQGIRRVDLRQSRYIGLVRTPPAAPDGDSHEYGPGDGLAQGYTVGRTPAAAWPLGPAGTPSLVTSHGALLRDDLPNRVTCDLVEGKRTWISQSK